MPVTRRIGKRALLWVLALLLLGYGSIVGWFKLYESRFVYFPDNRIDAHPNDMGLRYENVEIQSTDGVKLRCWKIPADAESLAIWILYFHGNAGNIARRGYIEHYAQLHKLGVNIFTVDYRGYGGSSGTPTESGIYNDARLSYAHLTTVYHVPPERIVVYGYSLGSAVAVELASKERIAGLIVEGAFTSLPDVGQELYPFLPVRLIAGNRFDSRSKIGYVTVPKLFIHALNDKTIPFHFGRELFEAASTPKIFLEVKGGHNSAHNIDAGAFYAGIAGFLEEIH